MPYNADILKCIGNTPLVKLNKVVPQNAANVLVKCEFMNPTGSVKDRMALYIIEQAEKTGKLKPGGMIVENTSGNTGLALAMVAAVKGYRCIFTMPDKMSTEKVNMLKAFGAQVVITPTDVPGDSPDHYVETAKRIAKETPNSFYVDQYHNQDNIAAHYHSTGPEIWAQTEGKFDYFVAGTGTGGTVSGVGRFIKEKSQNIKVVGVDPIGSVHYDYFYTKKLVEPKVYKVEGVGEDILCKALDFSVLDEMRQTNDYQAFTMARRLVREEGLFCGGASGSIVHAAVEIAKEVGPGKTIVTLLTDSGSRYITKFLSDPWMRDHGFLSPSAMLGTVADLIKARSIKQEVITASANETIDVIIQRLKKHGISQIPIVDQQLSPVSILHEEDILHKLQAGEITYQSSAKDIAHPMSGIVSPQTSLNELNQIFESEKVAIVINQGKITNIISKIDMIDYMMSKLNGH